MSSSPEIIKNVIYRVGSVLSERKANVKEYILFCGNATMKCYMQRKDFSFDVLEEASICKQMGFIS